MNRRDFIGLLSTTAATAAITPGIAAAAAGCDTMAGGVFYTREAPGRWAQKVEGHMPRLEITRSDQGVRLKVMTAHEMRGFEHYIVKHVVLNQNYKFIAEKMFDPQIDKVPLSEFALGKYQGRIHVLSVCNKHDTWLNHIDV